jgi:DNA polymerase (family 10)
MGTLLEFKGENVFKVRAYHKAADNILTLGEDIADLAEEDRLGEVPGIGEAMREKINEYLKTGRMHAYDELIKEVPEGVLEIVNIPTVGPKKAKLFFDKIGVRSVDDLAKAVETGKLQGLPGIQEKTIENIKRGLRIRKESSERMNLGLAAEVADGVVAALKKVREVKRISVAGSLRRMKETIRDIDILVDASDPQKVMDQFVTLPQVASVNAHGPTKSSIITREGVQVDVRIVEPKSYGSALVYFTGSKSFNVKLRQIAIKKHMKVSEYGVFKVDGRREKFLAGKTEEECFKALGLPYVPPELREDIGEDAIFSGKKIPKLIEVKDIKGDLHVHSNYSDGHNTIAEMAAAAQKLGYEYLGISDHSAKLKIAGGLSPEDLKKKKKEIDALNKKLKGFRVLFGTELEIDMDGGLDYNDKILSEFDFIVASIHSGFEQPKEKLTQRIINACKNKYVNAIGHPTGRHIGRRDSYSIDLKEVCKAAVDTNTFLEINAFPIRLDLDTANAYYARSQGVQFTINTDSHATEHLPFMRFGVGVARRGWLTADDVLNAKSLKQLEKLLKK